MGKDDQPKHRQAARELRPAALGHENDEGTKASFEAVASVPCFELWLLLHFEDVYAPIHRTEAAERLRNLGGVCRSLAALSAKRTIAA